MPAFESLQQHKNNQDATRRQSMSDQQAKGGIFSQFFHKYVVALSFGLVSSDWSCCDRD